MKRTAHRCWIGIAAVAVACAAVSVAHADQNPLFVRANQEYSEGHFQEAIKNYQSVVSSGQFSASLFYNLGNAWFRVGDVGQAILNYQRALALDPRHPEAAANLALVREEARALVLRPNTFERYLEVGTLTQYSIAASIAFWFALLLIARLYLSRRRGAALASLTIFSTILFAAAVFAIHSLESGRRGRALAIVTGNDVVARLATADNASSIIALPPGSEIKVLSQRGDWIYAVLPNDLRGWIPATSAQPVRM